mmetsp:Transcript_31957/g.52753  ORF Transcript_31957/g.52753 Transcript_31957/m.52753 type:complete len:339 (-) Transcript_31957:119-1135(-)
MMIVISFLSLLLLSTSHALAPCAEVNRRSAIQSAAAGFLTPALLANLQLKPAFAATVGDDLLGLTVPKGKSVLVLGANGKTGQECVAAALAAQRPCIATTRSGEFDFGIVNDKLSTAAADVSSRESIEQAIASSSSNLGAVVFAASTGTSGNNPFPVDKEGVINAAKCCIAAGIPRLVIVSSGTVTHPESAVYKLLNTFGKGIMEAKIQGEDTLRELYSDPTVLEKKLGYTIIRPGGLTTGESLGATGLELNQGDSKSGRLSRADVAALCVNCLDASDAFDTTFECYETSTAKPIEAVGFSNIMKSTDPTTVITGFERQGDSWTTLFAGLSRDSGHAV